MFTVTHPFHPWHGRRFALFNYRHNWGEYRVWFFDDDQRLRSLPATWTDYAPPDPFVLVAAGRSPARLEDLLHLVALVRALDAALPAEGDA